MKKNKLIKKMKESSKDIRVVKGGSIRKEVDCAIQEIIDRQHEDEIFFRSRAIKDDSSSYYSVSMPAPKKDFKRDFFGYWYYLIDEVIAMQIKVGDEGVLIIKEELL